MPCLIQVLHITNLYQRGPWSDPLLLLRLLFGSCLTVKNIDTLVNLTRFFISLNHLFSTHVVNTNPRSAFTLRPGEGEDFHGKETGAQVMALMWDREIMLQQRLLQCPAEQP